MVYEICLANNRTKMVKINLGANGFHLKGFINIDLDPNTNPELVADALHLPYEDNSIDEIYAGHLLEHFSEEEDVLKEWYRVLKPDGIITITVPDIEKGLNLYKDGKLSLQWINGIVFGAQDRKEQNHHQVFNEEILKLQMNKYFKDVNIISDSDYLLARVPWQTIVTAKK